MKSLASLALVAAIGTLPLGCAVYSNASYSAWEGPSLYTGTGGTKKTVDGIDIWQVGTPPCSFQVLGLIAQRNYNDGSPLAVLASATSQNDLVKQAKLHGGDAIVFLGQNTQVTGYSGSFQGSYQDSGYGTGYYNGTTAGHANTLSQTGVAVVKYLPTVTSAPTTESYMPAPQPPQP